MARQTGTDLGSVRTNTRSNKPKVSDKIAIFEFPPKKWITFRVHGATYSYSTYWVSVKKKDGKFTKFPVDSPSYDPTTQEYDSTKYDPWLKVWQDQKDVERDEQLVQVGTQFYINAIYRAAQKNEPRRVPKHTPSERKSGFKEKDSDSYTPNVALRLPGGAVEKIQKLAGLNTVTSKSSGATKSYPVSHEKYGCDVRIYYDPDAAPASKYDVQLVDKKTPLSEEELALLKWDLSDLANEADEKEVRRDFEGWAKRMGIKTSKKRKHDVEELDEDLEEDDIEDDEDEDEDEKPARGKKKVVKKKAPAKKTSKRKVVDEDDDDEEDEDEDEEDSDDFDEDEEEDEEEDEKPVRGKKKAPAKKTSKKKVIDEDDDEDEEDDEDEDEDDFDDDEDEEDEDEDEDEEEDEKPVRGKKKVVAKKKAPAKKTSKKKVIDEDDDEDEEDEDDDFDEDEDEDDEPVTKKKTVAKKAPAKKTVAKKTRR